MSITALSWALGETTGDPTRKLVLLILADMADQSGYSWPSQNYIAERAEVQPRAVRRHIVALEKSGRLIRTTRYRPDGSQTSNGYYLQLPESALDQEGRSPTTTPVAAVTENQGPRSHRTGQGRSRTTTLEPPLEPPLETNTCVLMWDMWKQITGLDSLKLTDNRKRRLKAVTKHLKPLAEEHETTVARLWALMVEAVWKDPWRREQRTRHDPVNVFKSAEQMETWADEAVARLRIERGTERTSTETADRRANVDAAELRCDVHHAALQKWYRSLRSAERESVKLVSEEILAKDFPGRSGTLSGVRKACMWRAMEQVSGIEESKEDVA